MAEAVPAWVLAAAGVTVGLYAAFVVVLVLTGHRSAARAVAGLIGDCVVLLRRLLADPRMPRRHRALLVLLLGYLLMPIDLVPDVIPVAGQLDDAIVVVLVLRAVLRAGGPELVREHWPGPEASLTLILRAAFGAARGGASRSSGPLGADRGELVDEPVSAMAQAGDLEADRT